jgi:SAM-dependent methyltransferase
MKKISAATVRSDFNDLVAVIHYTRAAHELGLWKSERTLIERFFPDRDAPLLEAGCGAGRVTLGLWTLGYRNLTAFDFAEELVDQARSLAAERHADAIAFLHADATKLPPDLAPPPPSTPPSPSPATGPSSPSSAPALDPEPDLTPLPPTPSAPPAQRHLLNDTLFRGALFMFNGLMQIPGRARRRAALRELHRVCAPDAPLLFTTHDREATATERALWRLEAVRWERGEQDPRLVEFGDRYFEEEGTGRTFMHLPDRAEILADLAATGWTHAFDAMRPDVAKESRAVLAFSDECRFWLARRAP